MSLTTVVAVLMIATGVWAAWQIDRMMRLLIEHMHQLLGRLAEVTMTLPNADIPAAHQANVALLARQRAELERLRPFWRRPHA